MGRAAVDSNQLFIDGLEVPDDDRIGEEGSGFKYILHGLNPERVLVGAEAIGLGRAALRTRERLRQGARRVRPADRAKSGDPASAGAMLDGAGSRDLMVFKAAWLYDNGKPCGPAANAAKFLGAEAGHKACQTAVMTLGGYGYAKEYHVERYFRESMIPRLAPVSPQLILCFIAERVLGLPKSY